MWSAGVVVEPVIRLRVSGCCVCRGEPEDDDDDGQPPHGVTDEQQPPGEASAHSPSSQTRSDETLHSGESHANVVS